MATGKLIIFSAPLRFGNHHYQLSADTNPNSVFLFLPQCPPREKNGMVKYFFLSPEEFKQRMPHEFLEYEEVYETVSTELESTKEKQLEAGQNVIFDVDVVGGCNIKNIMAARLSVFIQPPSVKELANA